MAVKTSPRYDITPFMIIGIDPGFSGAIAFFSSKGKLLVYDMPLHKIMGRDQVDARKLTSLLKCYAPFVFAAIEDVHTMPTDGVVTAGRFMYNTGILIGVLAALDIKILRMKPAVWKSALGLSSNKKQSLTLAKKTFPAYTHLFQRAKDDGRAEAALIAHFAWKSFS